MLGRYHAPALVGDQVYYCKDKGHEICKPKVVEENCLTITDKDGQLIQRDYHLVDVASCCGGEIGIWDDKKDEEVSFDYIFVEEKNKASL